MVEGAGGRIRGERGRRNVSPDIHDTYRRTPFSDRVKEVDSPLDLQSIERSVVARGLSRCVIKTSDERLGFRV